MQMNGVRMNGGDGKIVSQKCTRIIFVDDFQFWQLDLVKNI